MRKGYLIDHGVIFINRAYGTNWDWVGSTPWEGYWNDFDAPYYPSDKYGWVEAHFPNLWGAKQKWVKYLLGINDSQNRFLPKNSAQCSWQYLYHKYGTISGSGGTYMIDLTKVDPGRLRRQPAGRHGAQDLGRRQTDLVRHSHERRQRARLLEGHVRLRLHRDRQERQSAGSSRPGRLSRWR